MARNPNTKLNYIQNGTVPVKQKELEHEYESAQVQEEILNPKTIDIIVDGKGYKLPTELTLLDIKNKVENSIVYFQKLLISELNHIRPNIEWGDPIVTGVVFKESMQNAMAELLHIITKKPLSNFTDKLDELATINTFTWVLQMLNVKRKPATEDSGESQAPNVP